MYELHGQQRREMNKTMQNKSKVDANRMLLICFVFERVCHFYRKKNIQSSFHKTQIKPNEQNGLKPE